MSVIHDYKSIIHALIQQSALSPMQPVYIFPNNNEGVECEITFAQLLKQVETLSASLNMLQLYGERVLLVYQEIPEFITAFLACQYSGIVPVPVYYFQRAAQLQKILPVIRDADARTILCTSKTAVVLQDCVNKHPDTAHLRIVVTDEHNGSTAVNAPTLHEIAFLQYTSGSTGHPKGVIVSHKNLICNQAAIKQTFGCDKDAVIFSWLPFHHDMGLVGNILHAIYAGCTAVLITPLHFLRAPDTWLKYISKYKATHSGGPNFAYDLCVSKIDSTIIPSLNLAGWKIAFNGAEPVRYTTINHFSEKFKSAGFNAASFHPCYGLAEATLMVSGAKGDNIPRTIFIRKEVPASGKISLCEEEDAASQPIVSAGGIASGIKVKIISTQAYIECGELEEGEVCIGGDSITRGYWNRDSDTLFHCQGDEVFLRTGDLGFMYQGELYIHGRRDEMLILRGRNIYPYDLELMISQCSESIENNGVAIFPLPGSPDKIIVAVEVKRSAMNTLDADSVIRAISDLTGGLLGMAPHDVLLVRPHGIPRTTSGKLQRVKCGVYYATGAFDIIKSLGELKSDRAENVSMPELIPPSQVIELGDYDIIYRYLTAMIAHKVQHMRDDSPDADTELTAMGIDSLRATDLINTINRELHINVDIAKILQDNTLSGLIATIEGKLWLKENNVFE